MAKKKTKGISRSKLVKKADSIFSTYIRLRDADKHGMVTCPLCGARIHRKKAQNMHFITRACWFYRYSETNCHAGCMRCNVILHGNYIAYTRYMQNLFGVKDVDYMIAKSKEITKLSTPELQEIVDYYTNEIIKFAKKLTT